MNVATFGYGSRFLDSAVDHLRLTKTDAALVFSFLRSYGAYVLETTERAKQLFG